MRNPWNSRTSSLQLIELVSSLPGRGLSSLAECALREPETHPCGGPVSSEPTRVRVSGSIPGSGSLLALVREGTQMVRITIHPHRTGPEPQLELGVGTRAYITFAQGSAHLSWPRQSAARARRAPVGAPPPSGRRGRRHGWAPHCVCFCLRSCRRPMSIGPIHSCHHFLYTMFAESITLFGPST